MKTTRWFESSETWVNRKPRPFHIVIPCDFIGRTFQPQVCVEREGATATLYLPERPRSATVDAHDEPTRGVFTFDS